MTPIKIVIVGDGGAGKSVLLIRYTQNEFMSEDVPTIIFDNYDFKILIEDKYVDVAVWDTSGLEDFDRMRPLSYHQTDIFLVCFSIVNLASFNNVRPKWIPEVRKHCPDVPILLVGLKKDMENDKKMLLQLATQRRSPVSRNNGLALANEIKADGYVECSALSGENVNKVFERAIRIVLENQKEKVRESYSNQNALLHMIKNMAMAITPQRKTKGEKYISSEEQITDDKRKETEIETEVTKKNKRPLTHLMKACSVGDSDMVKEIFRFKILSEGEITYSFLESVDAEGWTAYHYAVAFGSLECIKMLIKMNANLLNIATLKGELGIHLAAWSGHDELIEYFITEKMYAIDELDGSGKTSLHLASERGHTDVVKKLVSLDANINAKTRLGEEKGATPLSIAVRNNQYETMEMLIDLGADIEAENNNKETPLHVGCVSGNIEIIAYLLLKGADPKHENKNHENCLQKAIEADNFKVARLLLQKTKSFDEAPKLLFQACSKEKFDSIDFILRNNSDKESLFLVHQEEYNVLMFSALEPKEKVLMSLLGFLVNEKEGPKMKKKLDEILHHTTSKNENILSILIAHGPAMKIYCDIIFSLEKEVHPTIESFSNCLKSRLDPSEITMQAIQNAEKQYEHMAVSSQNDSPPNISCLWIRQFFAVALIPLFLSLLDISTDCILIFKTYNDMKKQTNSSVNICSGSLVCLSINTNDTNQLFETASTLRIDQQLGFMIIFVLFPLVIYFFEWLRNDTIGFQGWLKMRKVMTENTNVSEGDSSRRSRDKFFMVYMSSWWWWCAQLIVIPLWPFIYLIPRLSSSVDYIIRSGPKKNALYATNKKETYASVKAIMAEVCTESSFQPILQLYLLLPCLIAQVQCSRELSLGEFIDSLQFWSVAASISALSWSFSAYTVSKAWGALTFFSAGFLCILLQYFLQITGRMILFTFLCYALENFWGGACAIMIHITVVFTGLLIQFSCKDINSEKVTRNPVDYIKHHLGNIILNSLANIYLQIWVFDDSQVTKQKFQAQEEQKVNQPLLSQDNKQAKPKIISNKNDDLVKKRADITYFIKGMSSMQPTFWVEFLILIENLIILAIVVFFMKTNVLAWICTGLGATLYIVGMIFKLIYLKKFHIWRHSNTFEHAVAVGKSLKQETNETVNYKKSQEELVSLPI